LKWKFIGRELRIQLKAADLYIDAFGFREAEKTTSSTSKTCSLLPEKGLKGQESIAADNIPTGHNSPAKTLSVRSSNVAFYGEETIPMPSKLPETGLQTPLEKYER